MSDLSETGSIVQVRYLDHVLQRNVEPEKAQPIIREAIGRVEKQNEEYLYLVVDEYTETRDSLANARKTTGFVILKSTILEVKSLRNRLDDAVHAVHCHNYSPRKDIPENTWRP